MGWGREEKESPRRRWAGERDGAGVLGLATEATEAFIPSTDHLCARGLRKGLCFPNCYDDELEAPLWGDP